MIRARKSVKFKPGKFLLGVLNEVQSSNESSPGAGEFAGGVKRP